MPGPIERIGAKIVTPQTEVKTGAKFTLAKPQAAVKGAQQIELPPMKEVSKTEQKTIEHDLRKRIETAGSQDPSRIFAGDMKDLKTRIQTESNRITGVKNPENATALRDRLSEIEAQFNAANEKIQSMPVNDNLRGLLSMQTEMYKMSQNIELLSKSVDALTSGVKQTLQTQV